jgi:hypothetical protein
MNEGLSSAVCVPLGNEISSFAPARPQHLGCWRMGPAIPRMDGSRSARIDPYNLLDWEEGDNIEPIENEGDPRALFAVDALAP